MEDPQLDFVSAAVTTVQIDSNTSAPSLIVDTLDPDTMGAMIALSLTIAKGSSTTSLDGVFSIDLHLRIR